MIRFITRLFSGEFGDYNAHASIIPIMARIIPKCKKKLDEAIQPKPGMNWKIKLNTTKIIPKIGSNPLRCAKYSDS